MHARPDTIAELTMSYIEWLQIRNYTLRTVQTRRHHLHFFISWCSQRDLLSPADITKPIIESYQRHLFYYRKHNNRPLAARTQYERLNAVQVFFSWLSKNNYILSNPASDIDLPQVPSSLPRDVLTAREAKKIINQPDVHSPIGIRDRAILETLYSTGMRRMECAGLTIHAVDLDGLTVMVRQGKGMRDRVVPIGEHAVQWVEKYLFDVRPHLVSGLDEGALFLSVYGRGLSGDTLSRLVASYIRKAGIGKTGSCHLFRHTMATLMLQNGADIRIIQEILGHQSVKTTQIYTRINISHLKEVHKRTHPENRSVRVKKQ